MTTTLQAQSLCGQWSSTSESLRGSGYLCQVSDMGMMRSGGILTNLYSLTSRLYVGLTSFTLDEGALSPTRALTPSIARLPSNTTLTMVGLSETSTWHWYQLSDHSILQLHESLGKLFWQNGFVGIDCFDSLPVRSSSSTPILRSQEEGPSFADAPSCVCSLFSLWSSKQLPQSTLQEFWDHALPEGYFFIISTAISSSPGQSELLKCCYSHSHSFPGGDALAELSDVCLTQCSPCESYSSNWF